MRTALTATRIASQSQNKFLQLLIMALTGLIMALTQLLNMALTQLLNMALTHRIEVPLQKKKPVIV